MMRLLQKYRTEERISIGRRPIQSDTGPENVVMIVAPMSDMATISPSTVGSLCNLNSFFMYRTAPGEDNCIVNDPTNISGLNIAKDNNWTPHNRELNGSNRSSRIKASIITISRETKSGNIFLIDRARGKIFLRIE